MSKSKKTVERERGFKTAGQVAALITPQWKDAEIALSMYDGTIRPINRVSFHENKSGRLIVIFHDGETDSGKLTIKDHNAK